MDPNLNGAGIQVPAIIVQAGDFCDVCARIRKVKIVVATLGISRAVAGIDFRDETLSVVQMLPADSAID